MPLRRNAAGSSNRPVFEPQCTHLTMARVYDPALLCIACYHPGPTGWLYQCTQDREELIEHTISRGRPVSFDSLGHQMAAHLKVRKGSPAAREDEVGFFGEFTPEKMAHYRPEQIATILRQRENVQAAIQLQRLRNDSTEIVDGCTLSTDVHTNSAQLEFKKPWISSIRLNSIANGDIPPTAAIGYGFHILGERPIAPAGLLKSLGQHPVPQSSSCMPSHLPSAPPRKASVEAASQASFWPRDSIKHFFRTSPPVHLQSQSESEEGNGLSADSTLSLPQVSSSLLKPSPLYVNFGMYSNPRSGTSLEPPSSSLCRSPISSRSNEEHVPWGSNPDVLTSAAQKSS